ncbi:hypothetical protein N2605_06555 [Bradyrhizobium yuanmingense]|uniref:hypothetical protein n=1 Tax=Bradyrhizobium yuanmingense TaxID=108015 RepID=UPI0021A86862|nr:hypothetical protein [Bradyrhizobium sp. CB1024]UWU86113.1 hypothetical protein N2605_06555 [Bradyrhizobium sp. CB1024]
MLARTRSLPLESSPLRASLTETVCWSRMQTEAGQELQAIVDRKELERSAGNGVFCWGVGNAPSRSIPQLVRAGADVDVVFSIMKSRPKAVDVAPSRLRIWRSFFDHSGREQPLPPATLITSRADAGIRTRNVHYALMCRSDRELTLGDFGPFDPSAYRNLSDTGGAVGASQVTALLRRVSGEAPAPAYRVNLKAKLGLGYWVRLGDPIDLTAGRRSMLERVLANLLSVTPDEWLRIVSGLRSGPSSATEPQPRLF